MNKPLLLLSLAVVATTAAAADSPLQRCRGLKDDSARLACYDAIPADSASSPAVQGAAVPAASRPADVSSFGLPAPAAADQELRSRITGRFVGWDAKTVLRLDNGQQWQIADGSKAYYQLDNPGVRIVRSAISGFLMEIDGVAQRPRVRRVK
jgi:hypothetical protein